MALGLGFVIFIHELGHFLLAKWNGVKVEKFSIGFGPTLFGFRRGETEYVLAADPAGGVRQDARRGDRGGGRAKTDRPAGVSRTSRSGRGWRSSRPGVIMNLILGLACFVYAYGQGMDAIPAQVGSVVPGSPAYRVGMRPGDEIVSIDGRRDIKFQTLTLKVSLSEDGQVLRFGVQRPGRDEPITMDIRPVRESGSDRPTIGIVPARSLELAGLAPPAGMSGARTIPG